MAVLDFPKNPSVGDTYDYPPFKYKWDGEKWRTFGSGANPVDEKIAAHRVEANAHNISSITGLDEAIAAATGDPVLSIQWVQKREAMWPGYVAADGQLLKRADYPSAWEAIQNLLVPVVPEDNWINVPANRGSFTAGDGSTTFRIPDYNGKYGGSLGATFLRGDGLNSAGTNGVIQGDAIREIEGTFGGTGGGFNRAYDLGLMADGAFARQNSSGYDLGDIKGAQIPTPEKASVVHFKASHTVPTAADNHPLNVTGCWAVRLFGYVQNTGAVDGATLATQIAALQSNSVQIGKENVVPPLSPVKIRGTNNSGGWVGLSVYSGDDPNTFVTGTYNGHPVIGTHNKELTEWGEKLYINCVKDQAPNDQAKTIINNPHSPINSPAHGIIDLGIVSRGIYSISPSWWINGGILRFMDYSDLMAAATNGASRDVDYTYLAKFRFFCRLTVYCPSRNVYSHSHSFWIGECPTTNASDSYEYPNNFVCHAGVGSRGIIKHQLVPGAENYGKPYWEYHSPVGDLSSAPDIEKYLAISAERIWG